MLNSLPVNMKLVFQELTLNLLMRMISGKRYFGGDIPEALEEGKRFRKIVDESFLFAGSSNLGDYLSFLNWLGVNGLEKKLFALREKRELFFQELIEQVRKLVKGDEVQNENKTMIEVLFTLQKSDPDYYTDEMIRDFVLVRSYILV